MSGPVFSVALESPRQSDVARLILELDQYLSRLYPAESNHILDIDALDASEVRFVVARSHSRAVGCGALKKDVSGFGEVKRMFVLPEARGRGCGRQILSLIEDLARAEGVSILRLETGIYQAAALTLYLTAGFRECGPFGGYRPDPLSLFLEKAI